MRQTDDPTLNTGRQKGNEGNTADTNEPDTTGRVKLNTLNMQTSDPSK